MRQFVRLHVHVTQPNDARLRAEAERLGLPVADVVRRAIDAWLDDQDRKAARRPVTNAVMVELVRKVKP